MLFAADPDLGIDLSDMSTSQSFVRPVTSFAHSVIPVGRAAEAKNALHTYFVLLASCLRILLSTFTSYGAGNEKTIYTVRQFLADYRGNMVGVFKRAAGLSLGAQNMNESLDLLSSKNMSTASSREMQKTVEECMKCYTGLAIGSGFLEYEDEIGLGGNGIASAGGSFGRTTSGREGFT